MTNIPTVQRVPPQPPTQLHTPGLEQPPPFEQAGEQIAEAHRVPLQPLAQLHTPGLEHVPPC